MIFVEYFILIAAHMMVGWLIGATYYRWGWFLPTLLLPLTVVPAAVVEVLFGTTWVGAGLEEFTAYTRPALAITVPAALPHRQSGPAVHRFCACCRRRAVHRQCRCTTERPGPLLAFGLATLAALALGLVIASVAPTARTTTAIAMAVYFPLLFFAGVWTPGPAMPDALRRIADFTPAGAAAEAMTDAWFGDWPEPLHLAVLIAWAAVAGFAAARLFRWE